MDAGPRQLRCLLAVLLLADGWVPRDELIGVLWDDPSDTAREDFYKLVGRLRKLLAEAGLTGALEIRDGLYRLRTPPGSVDVERFRTLVREAVHAEDERAAELLEEALRIASGEPMADLAGLRVDAKRRGLAEERRQARIELENVSLRLGRHRDRIPHLSTEFENDPGDETVAGLLMIALYRVGRQKEAFDVFFKAQRHIADTTGQDVGRELQELYQRMVSNDPRLHAEDAKEEPASDPKEKRRKTADTAGSENPTVQNVFNDRVDARHANFGIVHHHGARER
ncbi:AfsR/SARP family transcriptional regulator [Thermomonospora cellulosilytica]|uniref:DNA-binding SARP family transcriptional activator n=1 Tax=Thermomonospora cellulosilytica TaxID=1411118 RepID=A0A7W3R7S6_9ACTN|nr:AfsR/SARP family transcriptional regulator [Thermomonospora cellulosilytica]MBA9002987.1 DNA-binding SARP family transcriptional activator [Thermomonospora cellulosilytica]